MRQVERAFAPRQPRAMMNADPAKEPKPLAMPAVAAAMRGPSGAQTSRRKPTINDFPAILRQDTALDF